MVKYEATNCCCHGAIAELQIISDIWLLQLRCVQMSLEPICNWYAESNWVILSRIMQYTMLCASEIFLTSTISRLLETPLKERLSEIFKRSKTFFCLKWCFTARKTRCNWTFLSGFTADFIEQGTMPSERRSKALNVSFSKPRFSYWLAAQL